MNNTKYTRYKVTIELLTGLHIGMGNDDLSIGGIDSQVIKHKFQSKHGQAYIPGSSLKGKCRSLLEFNSSSSDLENVGVLFGTSADDKDEAITPTRLLFRDLSFDQETENLFNESIENLDSFYETKTEIKVSRSTGKAETGGLRQIERVPAGAKFIGEIVFKKFDQNDEDIFNKILGENFSYLKELLESDALGGSGSRGYGQITINFEKIKE